MRLYKIPELHLLVLVLLLYVLSFSIVYMRTMCVVGRLEIVLLKEDIFTFWEQRSHDC